MECERDDTVKPSKALFPARTSVYGEDWEKSFAWLRCVALFPPPWFTYLVIEYNAYAPPGTPSPRAAEFADSIGDHAVDPHIFLVAVIC